MPESRRRLLMTFVGNVGIIAVRPLLAAWQATGARRSATTASLAERSPSNFPPGLDGQLAKGADTKAIDCENQKELRSDVSRLHEMVSELKEQVEKPNSASTHSLVRCEKKPSKSKRSPSRLRSSPRADREALFTIAPKCLPLFDRFDHRRPCTFLYTFVEFVLA